MANLNIRVLIEVDKPISQIFQEEQANFVKALGDVDKVADFFPQWISKQSSLYMQRFKNIPTIPDDLKDLKIEGQWATALGVERFLLKHTKEREE